MIETWTVPPPFLPAPLGGDGFSVIRATPATLPLASSIAPHSFISTYDFIPLRGEVDEPRREYPYCSRQPMKVAPLSQGGLLLCIGGLLSILACPSPCGRVSVVKVNAD